MKTNFDVAVLGGGPAGSVVAGLLAHRGVNVVVVEQTDYSARRVGDSLPPAAITVLARLGLQRALSDSSYFSSPGIVSIWGSEKPFEHDFIRSPGGFGLRLDRRRFDLALAEWAVSHGSLLLNQARAQRPRIEGTKWHLHLNTPYSLNLQARFLVDASGRNALPIEAPVLFKHSDTLIALVSVAPASLLDRRILIESCAAGWWYSALLPTGELLVSYFTDRDLLQHGRSDLMPYASNAPFTADRLAACQRTAPTIYKAPSQLRTALKGPTWISVGDSASTFDPISGQGLCKALSEAEQAVHAIVAALEGDSTLMDQYETDVSRAFGKYLEQRRNYYLAEPRWRNAPFWERRTSWIH